MHVHMWLISSRVRIGALPFHSGLSVLPTASHTALGPHCCTLLTEDLCNLLTFSLNSPEGEQDETLKEPPKEAKEKDMYGHQKLLKDSVQSLGFRGMMFSYL